MSSDVTSSSFDSSCRHDSSVNDELAENERGERSKRRNLSRFSTLNGLLACAASNSPSPVV